MNSVNSFTMYFDYYNLIDSLQSTRDKAILLIAINDYMFKDLEPKLANHNQAIFNTLKRQLDKSKNNSKRRTTKEPEQNQNATETIPQQNKTSVLSFKFYIDNFKFINNNDLLINKLEEWFKYKQQRKDKYTDIGLKTLLNKIDKAVEKYGAANVISVIEDSIANNYQGIIFDKLQNIQVQSRTSNQKKWEDTKRKFLENDETRSN